MITFPICGLRNGGNSNIKEDGIPFNTVLDSPLDTIKVIIIPNKIIAVNMKAFNIEF